MVFPEASLLGIFLFTSLKVKKNKEREEKTMNRFLSEKWHKTSHKLRKLCCIVLTVISYHQKTKCAYYLEYTKVKFLLPLCTNSLSKFINIQRIAILIA